MSIVEFSYYSDSICWFAKDEIEGIWTYTEIIVTTAMRIGIIPIVFFDIWMKDKSFFKIGRLFLLPCLISGVIPSSHIFINVYDYKLCRDRHYFFDLEFAQYYQTLVTVFHIICTVAGIILLITLLTPEDDSEYQKLDERSRRKHKRQRKQQTKTRPMKLFQIMWFGFSYVFLGFQ